MRDGKYLDEVEDTHKPVRRRFSPPPGGLAGCPAQRLNGISENPPVPVCAPQTNKATACSAIALRAVYETELTTLPYKEVLYH